MSTADPEYRDDAVTVPHGAWGQGNQPYACDVALVREDDGSYSGVVLNLPGAGSCGDTEDETIAHVKEAVLGVIESYRAAGEPIPWRALPSYDLPAGAKQVRIMIHA